MIKAITKYYAKGKKGSAISMLLLGIALATAYEEMVGIGTWYTFRTPTDKVNVCFTPPSGCGSLIAQAIADARMSISMQAYSLTSQPIIHQLIAAHKRGVKVNILVDTDI